MINGVEPGRSNYLNSSQISGSKNEFTELLMKCQDNPENHLVSLSHIFNNKSLKNTLRNSLNSASVGSFVAYWDGAAVILNMIEQEVDDRIKKADLLLLKEDLKKLLSFFVSH